MQTTNLKKKWLIPILSYNTIRLADPPSLHHSSLSFLLFPSQPVLDERRGFAFCRCLTHGKEL
jgi:hypothetical protein